MVVRLLQKSAGLREMEGGASQSREDGQENRRGKMAKAAVAASSTSVASISSRKSEEEKGKSEIVYD